MAVEIERKFLVRDDSWRDAADSGVFLSQGYLNSDPRRCVRVRIAAQQAWLNIKSAVSALRRLEYEYEIPLDEARELLSSACGEPALEKTRFHVPGGDGLVWEVDVFAGANAGLVVAEIELTDERQAFARPAWLGEEVSDDPRYYNMSLAAVPFSRW
jgi:adenylate cyclase